MKKTIMLIQFILCLLLMGSSKLQAQSASCQASYNKASFFYNHSKSGAAINEVTSGCLGEINSSNLKNLDINFVFKIYKLLILSYQNNDQDGTANDKLNELCNLLRAKGYSKEAVQKQLEATSI